MTSPAATPRAVEHDDLCVWWDNVGVEPPNYACTCGKWAEKVSQQAAAIVALKQGDVARKESEVAQMTPINDDETMTEENQRRASPELEAAANKAARSSISGKALAEFATHSGLLGLLARELQAARAQLEEVTKGTHVIVSKTIWNVASKVLGDIYGHINLGAAPPQGDTDE